MVREQPIRRMPGEKPATIPKGFIAATFTTAALLGTGGVVALFNSPTVPCAIQDNWQNTCVEVKDSGVYGQEVKQKATAAVVGIGLALIFATVGASHVKHNRDVMRRYEYQTQPRNASL